MGSLVVFCFPAFSKLVYFRVNSCQSRRSDATVFDIVPMISEAFDSFSLVSPPPCVGNHEECSKRHGAHEPVPPAGSAHLRVQEIRKAAETWLDRVLQEEEAPNDEQLPILRHVIGQVLAEEADPQCQRCEPLIELIHGEPGTGKSQVLKWIVGLFTEVMGWKHEVHFMCVAFQNSMAAAIKGTTLHSGADLPLATEDGKCKTHTDIDQLWLKIQCLRWVLIDEISMVSAQLLHLFLERMRDATREPNTYKIRFSDGTVRLGGGYNFLFFGDWWQIAPVTGTPLFQVPSPSVPRYLENTVSIFWRRGADSIQRLWELRQQMRLTDAWYIHFVKQCRNGELGTEDYNFIHGFPTRHAGSWCSADATLACANDECRSLQEDTWPALRAQGQAWEAMQPHGWQQLLKEKRTSGVAMAVWLLEDLLLAAQ